MMNSSVKAKRKATTKHEDIVLAVMRTSSSIHALYLCVVNLMKSIFLTRKILCLSEYPDDCPKGTPRDDIVMGEVKINGERFVAVTMTLAR